MKYTRPAYLTPGISVETKDVLFGRTDVTVPLPDYPISAVENFKRAAARDNPIWVPNSLIDFQTLVTRGPLFGEQSGVAHVKDMKDGDRYIDWFGCDWTWVAEAGGPMLTPGTLLLDDITEWETGVKFPDLDNIDWEPQVKEFMENKYTPSKVMHINIGAGCTERLVAILGGYTESMLALAVEPEAVIDFLSRFSDFTIDFLSRLFKMFPVDMVTMHDDWGTERDTFFSEKMMEEIVFEPTKRIVDYVKSNGKVFELHSCGNITRFVPYMIDMGIDFMQIQRRAVNIPEVKIKYGDRIGVNTQIEGIAQNVMLNSEEEYLEAIRKTVDLYAKGGGFYTSAIGHTPEETWDAAFELYCYSREYYDKERGE